jgi:hypothetical protein
MIIPSQHASRVARAAAGGGDVTPNAVNWANVTGEYSNVTTSMLQITGIASSITLKVSFVLNTGIQSNQKYSVQSSASFGTGTAIANDGTFTVSNNQYVGFRADCGGACAETKVSTWTITNVSDGNAVLDTFTITTYPLGP